MCPFPFWSPHHPSAYLCAFPAAWRPSAAESPYYNDLWQVAAGGALELSGRDSVAFLTKSDLDRGVLKQIWAAANLRNGLALNQHEFNIAMRLVALGQAGQATTREHFMLTATNTSFPLPRFQGIAPPPATGAALGSGASPWTISAADQAKYDTIFAGEDADHDGRVSGAQAAELFRRSGLDKSVSSSGLPRASRMWPVRAQARRCAACVPRSCVQ